MRLIAFMLLISIIGISGTALAIKPLEDQLPSNVSEENVKIGENIDTGTIVSKETKMSIARIHEQEASSGDLIEITLLIKNQESSEMGVFVTEFHVTGVQYTDPIEVKYVNFQAFRLPYYGWSLNIPGNSSKEISYHIRATAPGFVSFSPATVADEFGNVFESSPTVIKIRCNANGFCEKGENFANCPEDCETGIADDSCDGVTDGKIDPDCAPGFDPDSGLPPAKTPEPSTPGFEPAFGILALTLAYLLRRKY